MKWKQAMVWGCGIAVVTTLITTYSVSSAASTRWGRWEKQVDAVQSRLDRADVRPVLFGDAVPGSAWDAYSACLAMAKADPSLEVKVRPTERTKLPTTELKTLLAAHAETLAQLRRGAHCREVRDPVEWEHGFSEGNIQNLLSLRSIANLAVTQALAHLDGGRPVEAVETLLDSAQFGRDLMHSRVMINEILGSAVILISTRDAVQTSSLLDRLSPAALDRFANGLKTLDEHIARVGPGIEGDAVLFAHEIQNRPEDFTDLSLHSWRYGFSSRLMIADAGLRLLDTAERVQRTARRPWATAGGQLTDIESELRENTNPVLANASGPMNSIVITRLETVARIRLLRMAIEHRRGRSVPGFEDPFGKTLQHGLDAEGRHRFWSVGSAGSRNLFLFRLSF